MTDEELIYAERLITRATKGLRLGDKVPPWMKYFTKLLREVQELRMQVDKLVEEVENR